MRERESRYGVAGAAALLMGLLLTGCGKGPFTRTEAKEESPKETPVPVETAPVARGPIEAVLETSTNLEAEQEVRVLARTANRVTALRVEEGDRVSKGDVLLRLDDDIQRSALQKAEARYDKARAEFERIEVLHGQSLVSEQVYTDSRYELRQLELAVEDARRELEYTEVRAPIPGTVTRRMVKTGDLVNVNQHLFDLINFDSIVARLYLPEDNLAKLAVNQPVRVRAMALGGALLDGYIQRIAPVVESKTGTVKVTVAFKDVGPLRPGMYVEAEIVTATCDDALLVSRRSLVYDGDQIFVYRVGSDRTVERLLVEPGLADRLHVQPVEGIREGDEIVVAGQTGLKDGARVRRPGDPDPSKEAEGSDQADAAAE